MHPINSMVVIDFLKPFYYRLEKKVASQSIPSVHEKLDRQKLDSVSSAHITNKFDHSLWDEILKSYVDTSGTTINEVTGVNTVDYDGISGDPKFDEYLTLLEGADPSSLSPAEQLAFWMNCYNALCINLIVSHERDSDNTKLTSINQLSENGKAVWDKIAGKVHGQEISLNHIEHDKLRGSWDEPGLHGCIVCASSSCPNLRNEAFVGTKVRAQIDDQMKQWMKNPTKGCKLSNGLFGQKRVELSRIFLWFGDDFGGWEGLRKWLPQHLEESDIKTVLSPNHSPQVRYFKYDWSINRKVN